MKAYAYKVAVGAILLVVAGIAGLASAAQPRQTTPPQQYTIIVITETYHGSSSVAVSGYPSLAECHRAIRAVAKATEFMSEEKETDFLYTDAYCIPSFGTPHDHQIKAPL